MSEAILREGLKTAAAAGAAVSSFVQQSRTQLLRERMVGHRSRPGRPRPLLLSLYSFTRPNVELQLVETWAVYMFSDSAQMFNPKFRDVLIGLTPQKI